MPDKPELAVTPIGPGNNDVCDRCPSVAAFWVSKKSWVDGRLRLSDPFALCTPCSDLVTEGRVEIA